ncbi:MAG: dienelactone hydrolase family protein [Mesorhizobium sp.]|uniref:dienelactone hydrolase family protein n=3 Tax=unclassified Mesorhizobium TaxID=325217 RepID=UPI000FE99B97|nr:dienelactone hydrolase family protein [Mesorhizobium sp.]RWC40310.1 MAG: dienelactone hydrolase family protein [Mesorhizobium sp.]RWE13840.1 MAG: dienelactone hydrolase family protein [Mesorhizobium sp.]RWE59723.1 MAG: dienelactone hydrolase family protein [Mesorhizobium sp.]RWE83668.1 MAG: dienelactone hydrolase family protein [Mesorhizobium sp.]RWE90788.1 MAG: dienelactone hydrolase family protein [Mesorhizobium sp.]
MTKPSPASPAVTRPAITQAMIDAYDEYTHLTLDRRRFMEQLTRLAGSGAAAAAIAPLLAANSAQAAIVADDDPRVKGEDISYPGSGGEMKGYLVKPADQTGKLGTVIVVHENRGLNPHIRDVARRVALEGFVALAPDFMTPLGGTPADENRTRDLFSKLDPAQVGANAVATVAFLKEHADGNGKVGAVGFCWGGGTVNTLAANTPDLAAAVAYYGMQPKADDVPKIKAALLLHYAGLDTRINAGIDAFKKELDAAKVEYTVYVYEGANHAFNNDTSAARYDKNAADLAWGRTIAFLKEKLA